AGANHAFLSSAAGRAEVYWNAGYADNSGGEAQPGWGSLVEWGPSGPGTAKPQAARKQQRRFPMNRQIHIIRDSFDARPFLAQALGWRRVLPPRKDEARLVLTWAKELASGGQPLPPVGFVADLGHVTLGEDWEMRSGREQVSVPNLPMNLVRT